MSDKSLAELEKPHAVTGSGAAIASETLQALRQHWEVAGSWNCSTADSLFWFEHVTVILSPQIILLLTGTLEVVNIISEQSQ